MSPLEPSLQDSQSTIGRNPRRRQRNSAEDGSSRQQQPQRKRLKAHGDGFKAASEVQDEVPPSQMNGHVLPKQDNGVSNSSSLEMPVRGKQQHGPRRGYKDEGSIILTKNANYVVKHLPSLPENIRLSRREALRGAFLAQAGYTLALTRTQAFVWDYVSASSTPTARVFTLQHPSRPSEPLPLGALVASGSGGDTGLVVVNSTSGKITYWESIENADALSLFEQRRNGIFGSCGNLLSGETVVDLENADPVGFILRFSSGRTAQLLLRDFQSRPAISVRYLQAQNVSGGFLSGLKSVFVSGHWMKNVVAARTHPSNTRGVADIILVSEEATFQFWQLSWAGQTLFRREINAKMAIVSAASSAISDAQADNIKINVVDFAIIKNTSTDSTSLIMVDRGSETICSFDMLVLVAVVSDAGTSFALVEVEATEDTAMARRSILLHSYCPMTKHDSGWTPRVCLPGGQDTAFVVFERAVVLVSLATVKLSPDAQILMDAEKLPEPFQDTIYLKDDQNFCVVGVNAEESSATSLPPSILLFVENFGILRITTIAHLDDEQAIQRSRISAKSKIEQAVFFGSVAANPLDLCRVSQHVFSNTEVETAALETSKEVCATDARFLPAVAPSMEFHLEQRARILEHLAAYIQQYNGISRVTRWKLRCDAEKMAAARRVWFLYNEKLHEGDDLEARLLPQILLLMSEKYKTVADEEQGERDRVRQWFLKDVWRMENLVAWPWRAIQNLEKEKEIKDEATYLEHLSDACDIVLGSLDTAFTFRKESASRYGLQDERLTEHGILASGYEDLPELWTSILPIQKFLPIDIVSTMKKLTDLDEKQFQEHENVVNHISKDLPGLIDVYCKCSEERYGWNCAHPDAKERTTSEEFKQTYERNRSQLIQRLPQVEQTMQGFSLAEEYQDMEALVILVQELSASDLFKEANRDDPKARKQVEAIEKRIKRYFAEYQDDWANAFYSYQISRGAFTKLLDQASIYGDQLTRYLRADQTREKLSWINDVLGESGYSSAGQSLLNIAEKQETDLWSKKVELSIAKLALAASQTKPEHEKSSNTEQDDALELVKLQERLYDHVRHSFYDAVDQPAELQLAMSAFGTHAVKGRHNLQQLLERCLERLINHEAMDIAQLVDVLTLMDQRPSELGPNDIYGQEMFLALDALRMARSGESSSESDLLLRITYRRCFIRDDWRQLDSTAQKSDQDAIDQLESTTLFRTFYEGYALGLWSNGSDIPILYPDDVLGTGTTPNELKYRFPDSNLCERLAKDMAIEDGIMQHYVNKYRLKHWIKAAEDLAKERLNLEAETEAERGEKVRQVVIQLEGEDEDLEAYKGRTSMHGTGQEAEVHAVNGV